MEMWGRLCVSVEGGIGGTDKSVWQLRLIALVSNIPMEQALIIKLALVIKDIYGTLPSTLAIFNA